MVNWTRFSGGPICCVALWLALNSPAFATSQPTPPTQSVTLGWAASSDPTVVGYSVSYGSASGVYTNTVNVGTNLTFILSGLAPGSTYYFIANSYNASGINSIPTPEIAFVVPFGSPSLTMTGPSGTNSSVNLQFQVAPSTSYELQASSDLRTWTNIWTFSSGNTNGLVQYTEPFTNTLPARFYRLVVP